MDLIAPFERDMLARGIDTLERAFFSDPMFVWMFPNAGDRSRALRLMNGVPLEYGLRYGRVTQARGGRAVAIWIPPRRTITVGGMVRSGMLRLPLRIGLRAFVRFAGANAAMAHIHKTYVPDPHWYLLIVGVDPELQGQGLGSALVEEGLARADNDRCACYLETGEERNLAFYERFGFYVLESALLGEGGPTAWGMRRDRRAN
jgi:ribosomal protein S18 acetylase RimI-like enzyme